jgi:hypothetical protein
VKFKMRYVVGGALALGIAAGVWLSDWFKGIGVGGGSGVGIGQSGWQGMPSGEESEVADLGVSYQTPLPAGPVTLRVVIKDRSYFLRDGETDTPIELAALVDAVKQHPADEDGIRLRLYRTNTARVTAELQLREALQAAGIPDAAVFTYEHAVE